MTKHGAYERAKLLAPNFQYAKMVVLYPPGEYEIALATDAMRDPTILERWELEQFIREYDKEYTHAQRHIRKKAAKRA